MSLQIIVSDGYLDLLPNASDEFYITKQLHDLHELDTRKGDFTKEMTIPYTPNNRLLLWEFLPENTKHSERGTQFIDCQVLISGTPAIEGAYMRVESGDTRGFQVSIYSGNVKFFSQLKSNGIDELDWSEFDGFDWNLANLAANMENTEGMLYANSFWYTNESLNSYILNNDGNPTLDLLDRIDLNASGFFLYCRTILNKIFEQLDGLTVNFDTLNPLKGTVLNETAIGCNMTAIQESYNTGEGYSGNSAGQALSLVTTVNLTFPLAQTAATNIVMTNSQWVVQPDRDGVARLVVNGNYRYDFVGGTKTGTVSVMQNNTVLRNLPLRYQQNNAVFFYDGDHAAIAGDTFWLRLSCRRNDGTTGVVILWEINATFSINKGGTTGSSNIVNLRDYVPDFSQKEFVRAMLNMFHIVPKELNGVVNLYYWDDIPEAASIDLDYDQGQEYLESGIMVGYSRNNFMRYTPHPAVQNNADQSITVDVATEDVEQTKVQLPFTPLDIHQIRPTSQVSCMPYYSITKVSYAFAISWVGTVFTTAESHNLNVGDTIRNLSGQRAKVLLITDNQSGVTDVQITSSQSWYSLRYVPTVGPNLPVAQIIPRPDRKIFIQDGANAIQNSGAGYFRAIFSDAISWPTLINNYYRNFANSIRSPYVVNAYFELSVLEFIAIDQLAPVYIKSLGATFYVNSIDQYTGKGLVRMELIQVGATNDIPSTFLDLQGAYSSAFSNDFNNFPEDTPSN